MSGTRCTIGESQTASTPQAPNQFFVAFVGGLNGDVTPYKEPRTQPPAGGVAPALKRN